MKRRKRKKKKGLCAYLQLALQRREQTRLRKSAQHRLLAERRIEFDVALPFATISTFFVENHQSQTLLSNIACA